MIMEIERPKRIIVLETDDVDKAFDELRQRRSKGPNETGWDLAETRYMPNPPKIPFRYCVYRLQ